MGGAPSFAQASPGGGVGSEPGQQWARVTDQVTRPVSLLPSLPCIHILPSISSPSKRVMGTNDASGTGPGPGSSRFWSPPCPSILALGAWVGKGTSFAYSPGMMHQNRNPHQRASLVLPWCFPLLSLLSYLPPGEKCRDVGARDAWVHVPALPVPSCGSCRKKRLHLSGLCVSSSRL